MYQTVVTAIAIVAQVSGMAAATGNVTGFSRARLFRPSVAYVREKEDRVYEFRVNVVDLRSGSDQDLTLSVPFAGELPVPESGISSYGRGTPAERVYAHGPNAVRIDRIDVDGDQLTFVIAHDSDFTALTFDLSAMLADE